MTCYYHDNNFLITSLICNTSVLFRSFLEDRKTNHQQRMRKMIRFVCISLVIFAVLMMNAEGGAVAPMEVAGPQVAHAGSVNSGGDAKPANQMDAFKKEQLKKDLGKRMSVLEAMDKKGNDEDFVPWAMGWISSATGISAGNKK